MPALPASFLIHGNFSNNPTDSPKDSPLPLVSFPIAISKEPPLPASRSVDIAKLFDDHFDDVYGYVAFRLAPQNDAATDLAQDVFHAAMRTREPLRSHKAARAWLLEIARNKVADHLRAQLSRNHHIEQFGESHSHAQPSAAHERGTEDETARAIRVARIINQLPDRFATLLEDKYILGLTVQAMAIRHGTTSKAVESALGRARDAFRRAWSADEAREESMSCDKRT